MAALVLGGLIAGAAGVTALAQDVPSEPPTAADAPPRDASPAAPQPGAATAAPPTTTEATEPDPELEARMRQRRLEILRSATRPTTSSSEAPATDAELLEAEAEAMVREHAPYLYRRIRRVSQDPAARDRLMRPMIERYRELQRVRTRDPEQFQRELQQVTLEDEVTWIARRLNRAQSGQAFGPGPTDPAALKVQLRESVGRLVDLRLRLREARLQRLAKTLAQEQKKLEHDRANREKVVDRQVAAMTNNRRGQGGENPGGSPERSGSPGGAPLASPPGR